MIERPDANDAKQPLEIFKVKARLGALPIKLKIPARNMKEAITIAHELIDAACNISRSEGARIRKCKATGEAAPLSSLIAQAERGKL
jgi:hypothetical protein